MKVPVNIPLLRGNEKKYVLDCINTNWISSGGKYIEKFENNFSEYIGTSHSISCSNGSAALDIAIKALNYPEKSEIIVQTFTIISPILSIIKNNCRPVFIDSRNDDFNIDYDQIESKINKNTKAILVAHMYCYPAKMDKIIDICEKHNIDLIEDSAEMHGQEFNGKKCGSFGRISTFSFYANKIITTGEGGMIVTSEKKIADKCKKYRNLSFEPDGKRFIHNEFGWNYRMTNIQAAIGFAQLEKINYYIDLKRKIGNYYIEHLNHLKNIKIPTKQNNDSENIFWVFPLLFKNKKDKKYAEKFYSDSGIETRPMFYPMHLQPVLIKNKIGNLTDKFPNSENIYNTGLYIPSGLGNDFQQFDFVIEKTKQLDELL